jgi:dTDP-4-amino-4,6-dideoxygalactose transaminase
MTTGSGGAILTDDEASAELCRHLSTQAKTDEIDHIHDQVGFNYRMAAVNAAIGMAQLDALDDFLAAKERIAKSYRQAFKNFGSITCMPLNESGPDRPWLFCVLDKNSGGRNWVEHLNKHNIQARRLWRPLADQPFINKNIHSTDDPVSTKLFEEGFCLPSSINLTDEQMHSVIQSVADKC